MTSNNPIGLLLTTSYVFISSVFMSLSIADCGCKVKKSCADPTKGSTYR